MRTWEKACAATAFKTNSACVKRNILCQTGTLYRNGLFVKHDTTESDFKIRCIRPDLSYVEDLCTCLLVLAGLPNTFNSRLPPCVVSSLKQFFFRAVANIVVCPHDGTRPRAVPPNVRLIGPLMPEPGRTLPPELDVCPFPIEPLCLSSFLAGLCKL